MKSIAMKLWLMCGFIAVVAPLFAETEVVKGIVWNYRIVKDKAEIYKRDGSAIPASTTGAIAIPSALGGKSVTRIGHSAFSGCNGLTSVTIPDGVTGIGQFAFAGCRSLTNQMIPAGVTCIEYGAFVSCRSLTNLTISAGVTRIGANAFSGCDKLTSVTLPNGVTSVGDRAFEYCKSLTSVVIPDSVTNIGAGAFSKCGGIKSFIVADDNPCYKSAGGFLLTKDGTTLLSAVGVLTSVKIPDGVKFIGGYIFAGCDSMTSVTLPNSVTSIDDRAFSGCHRLPNITIPNSVTNIGSYAFQYCRSLTNIMIPKSVTRIGAGAFSGCSGLKSVVIADDNPKYKFANSLLLTKDGTGLIWASCTLPSVTIPDGVKTISYTAFDDCNSLTSVTIPKSVTLILGGTFSKCSELESLEVANDNTKYRSVNGLILTKDGTTLVDAVGGLTSIVIPDGVSCVEGGFSENRRLERITIPASVTSIGQSVFSRSDTRSALKSIIFNGNAPAFRGHFAFYGTAYVRKDSVGWGVDIPGKWNGIDIKYVDDAPAQAPGRARSAGPKNAGGKLAKDTIRVTVDAQDLSMFSGRVLSDLLPKGENASIVGGKWKFAKAASVKWAKPKKGAPLPDIYDEKTGMGLVVDTTKGKTNISGLTLVYTKTAARGGTFKGKFNVYELQGEGALTKLREYVVNVNGTVVDGVGKGTAICRKPYFSWPVTIE